MPTAEMPAAGPNQAQIEYWNDVRAGGWLEHQDQLDGLIAPLGEAALAAARPAPGERVLEVGCGTGASALALARAVGPEGHVTALDIVGAFLERVAARAAAEGLGRIETLCADAQIHDFPHAAFDLVFSRLGIMFFADPPAAFANLRRALAPDGRLAFVCWQALPRNPWVMRPMQVAAQVIELPAPPAPGTPGPFSLADPDRVRAILDGAGFRDVTVDAFETDLHIGADLDAALHLALNVGPLSGILREAGEEARAEVAPLLRAELEQHARNDGVHLGAAAWVVRARP